MSRSRPENEIQTQSTTLPQRLSSRQLFFNPELSNQLYLKDRMSDKAIKFLSPQALTFAIQFVRDAELMDHYLDVAKRAQKVFLPAEYNLPQLVVFNEGMVGEISRFTYLRGRFDFLYDVYSGHLKTMYVEVSPVRKSIICDPELYLDSLEAEKACKFDANHMLLNEAEVSEKLTESFYKKTKLFPSEIIKVKLGGVALGVVAAPLVAIYIARSSDPIEETIRQGTILGAAYVGATMLGESALIPCATTGPYAPLCVAGASLLGGFAGAMGAELACDIAKIVGQNPLGPVDYSEDETPLCDQSETVSHSKNDAHAAERACLEAEMKAIQSQIKESQNEIQTIMQTYKKSEQLNKERFFATKSSQNDFMQIPTNFLQPIISNVSVEKDKIINEQNKLNNKLKSLSNLSSAKNFDCPTIKNNDSFTASRPINTFGIFPEHKGRIESITLADGTEYKF